MKSRILCVLLALAICAVASGTFAWLYGRDAIAKWLAPSISMSDEFDVRIGSAFRLIKTSADVVRFADSRGDFPVQCTVVELGLADGTIVIKGYQLKSGVALRSQGYRFWVAKRTKDDQDLDFAMFTPEAFEKTKAGDAKLNGVMLKTVDEWRNSQPVPGKRTTQQAPGSNPPDEPNQP